MIFLPNKFELYCHILRNTLQILILKNGYKTKYIKNLMKIHKAEAIFSCAIDPVNIKGFCCELLKAARLKLFGKGRNLEFKINECGTVFINKKLFTALLLSLCKSARKIEILPFNEKILIKADNVRLKDNKKLLKAINAVYFYLPDTKSLSVLISVPKTDKKPQKELKDWEVLLNPLSVVNIYLP